MSRLLDAVNWTLITLGDAAQWVFNDGLGYVGSLLGLMGGLILRQAVLICGALPTLNIAGFQFRRIHRPKVPKAGIGMLPPQ